MCSAFCSCSLPRDSTRWNVASTALRPSAFHCNIPSGPTLDRCPPACSCATTMAASTMSGDFQTRSCVAPSARPSYASRKARLLSSVCPTFQSRLSICTKRSRSAVCTIKRAREIRHLVDGTIRGRSTIAWSPRVHYRTTSSAMIATACAHFAPCPASDIITVTRL